MTVLNDMDTDLPGEFSLEQVEAHEYVEDFGMEEYEEMGIDPITPTEAKPGSEEKVLMLSARYAAGLPLWHSDDCYDHGPGGLLSEDSLDFEEEADFEEEEAEV